MSHDLQIDLTPAPAPAELGAEWTALDPASYDPRKNMDTALERRNYVLQRMQEDGYITPAEAEAARMVSAGRFAAWVLAGAGWAMSWLWAVAPARFWEDLARREWRALAIAALAGTVAWLGGIAAQFLWKPLGVSVFWLSRGLLGWFYPDVVAHAGDLVQLAAQVRMRIESAQPREFSLQLYGRRRRS